MSVPPALLRYRVSESLSVPGFFETGRSLANLVAATFRNAGAPVDRPGQRILDFGCGCGRVTTWMLNEQRVTSLDAVDTDAEAIAWCHSNIASARFAHVHPLPPLPFEDATFDAIYGVSVFTHLDESMQDAWFAELKRVLKPHGWLLFTVHGSAAAAILPESDRGELRAHGFLHVRSQRLKGVMPDWYHTTFHVREYLMERLRTWFAEVRYDTVTGGNQDIVLCRA